MYSAKCLRHKISTFQNFQDTYAGQIGSNLRMSRRPCKEAKTRLALVKRNMQSYSSSFFSSCVTKVSPLYVDATVHLHSLHWRCQAHVKVDFKIAPKFIHSENIKKLAKFPQSGGLGDVWKCSLSTPSETLLVSFQADMNPIIYYSLGCSQIDQGPQSKR